MYSASNNQPESASSLPQDDFISRLLAETALKVEQPVADVPAPTRIQPLAPVAPPLPSTGPLDIDALLSSPHPVSVPPPPNYSAPVGVSVFSVPVAPTALVAVEVEEANQSRTRCKSCQQPFPISRVFEVRRVQYGVTQFQNDYCAVCTDKLKADYRREITLDSKGLLLALLLGLMASLVAGAVLGVAMASVRRYYQPLALAMGAVVAYAMIYGSGKKRNISLMFLAVLMTLPGLLLSVYVQYWLDFSSNLSLISFAQLMRYLQIAPLYISDYIAFVLAMAAAFCVPLAPDLYVTAPKGKPEKVTKANSLAQ